MMLQVIRLVGSTLISIVVLICVYTSLAHGATDGTQAFDIMSGTAVVVFWFQGHNVQQALNSFFQNSGKGEEKA